MQPAYHACCSPPLATAPPFEGESFLLGGPGLRVRAVLNKNERTNECVHVYPVLSRFSCVCGVSRVPATARALARVCRAVMRDCENALISRAQKIQARRKA